MKIHILLLFR